MPRKKDPPVQAPIESKAPDSSSPAEAAPTASTIPATAQDPAAQAVLYGKLAKVMATVRRMKKSGWNDHFRYHFATNEDVLDLVRGSLAEEGVAFFADLVDHRIEDYSIEAYGKSKSYRKTLCRFRFTFACGSTGATIACEWTGEADDSQDKGINKAATAALKYWLLKTFMISTGDEPDTDGLGDQGMEAEGGGSRKGKAGGGSRKGKAGGGGGPKGQEPQADPMTAEQRDRVKALMGRAGLNAGNLLAYTSKILRRAVRPGEAISSPEAAKVIAALEAQAGEAEPPPARALSDKLIASLEAIRSAEGLAAWSKVHTADLDRVLKAEGQAAFDRVVAAYDAKAGGTTEAASEAAGEETGS